jgi:hypothetical protein
MVTSDTVQYSTVLHRVNRVAAMLCQPFTFQAAHQFWWRTAEQSRPVVASSLSSSTTDMSFLPPPPPGMPVPLTGMPPPPPGMPPVAQGDPSSSRLPPEVLALKSQKWIQMQKKRYGQKRKGGYIDMGKQVRSTNSYFFSDLLPVCCIGYAS